MSTFSNRVFRANISHSLIHKAGDLIHIRKYYTLTNIECFLVVGRVLFTFSIRVLLANISHSQLCMADRFVPTRKYYTLANIECFLVVDRVLFTGNWR